MLLGGMDISLSGVSARSRAGAIDAPDAIPLDIVAVPSVGAPAVASASGAQLLGLVAASTVGLPAAISVDGVAPTGIVATPTVGAPTVTPPASNLVVNGTFDDTTGLSGAGHSVSGGKLVFSAAGVGSSCRQTISGGTQPAGNYTWSAVVSGYSAGAFRVSLRSGGGSIGTSGDIESDGVQGGNITASTSFDAIWVRIEEGPATLQVDDLTLVPA